MVPSSPLHPPSPGYVPQPVSLEVSSASPYPKLPGVSVFTLIMAVPHICPVLLLAGGLWEAGVGGGSESQLLDHLGLLRVIENGPKPPHPRSANSPPF